MGLKVGAPFGPFLPVDLGNGVTRIPRARRAVRRRDRRLEAVGVTYHADLSHTETGQINSLFGGHGAYFDDPDGRNMEIRTRPHIRP